jgi:tripartite-type tricarboxylate transporter receptor subunit TctC
LSKPPHPITVDEDFGFRRKASEGAVTRSFTVARLVLTVMTLAVLAIARIDAARADPIADFYRGKTVRMIIGYGVGGGYDLYARITAEFLGRHIPGNPRLLPENLTGAGSFLAAKYLNEVAPHDGTTLGSLAQTLALDAATGTGSGLDVTQFHYIGRLTSSIDLGVALPSAGITSFDDVRKREFTVGSSGGASTAVLLPASLAAFGGAKFKLVRGYKGAAEMMLALERGEVQIAGAVGIPLLLARHPDWILQGKATFVYQAALKRSPYLPQVPALPELGLTDDGRAVLRALAGTAEIGRSIITTPGVPKERLAALRRAFADMLKDPDFIAACKQRHIMIDPGTGEDMDAIVSETVNLPKPIIAKLGVLLRE